MDDIKRNDGKDREQEKDERREPGAGITNRPDAVERENQERLPPRGQEKAGD